MKMISWNITRRCNLKCQHCYRDSGPDSGSVEAELTTIEGLQLLNEIAEEGFSLVIFSGGEPLIRSDLEELVAEASSLGMHPVLGTNAVSLTEERLSSLKEAGLQGMGISLDSYQPDQHDEFRGVEGAWQKAVRAAKMCAEKGMPVQINATISRDNCGELTEMIELSEEIGARSFHPFFLVPTGRGKEIEEAALRPEEHQEVLKRVLRLAGEADVKIKPTCAPQFMALAEEMGISLPYSRGCLAGVSYCCILPEGDVHICPYLPVAAGHVREKSFSQIWQESEIFERLRDFSQYRGSCGSCSFIDVCGGCRARAYYYSDGSSKDNVLAGDPWCRVTAAGRESEEG
ncbi:radical SAM/SPASM domain-containing protein [Halarsenatibacter silvermanii]|uniref:Radical SAM additional 4Fe4S-binding SPASM domain-containing protein n=1 Tax=Halarsenatibacter silvermanii TaxID=321763 RepID=A0A1G9Q1C8_9FIRM|nr:radical SAM protein [Halarsenatibacter silvermanii]SDM04820.1 radical SAM additional 4Fe4S-binding SPASM domain-containing protein [Halarsenatibacter silvermanii]